MNVIGIDLAGRAENPSGLAILAVDKFKTKLVKSDNEIIGFCLSKSPEMVAIDAPLSFPKEGGLRKADAELIHRGYRVLPPILEGMKILTKRGIKISERFEQKNLKVIEIHPRTSGKILFKTDKRKSWISKLERRGWCVDPDASKHEIDAAVGALTALLHLQHKTLKVGERGREIVIPRGPLKAP
ncbi:hypothetical protein AKJ43_00280 [candidate division MSBL1 archaeon SCGC-AAA261D19]|uniref:DUF429 domain-containing protein n=1 Tax=candidate division MSBL1 archaeon SCGC-AAA261D19 TaxID=1698273 RepID=A0A133V8U4_9EURY|nr:hypothetical protein AKJ43_00280 [candidate division MSBL1 archaeon SCGC-AAA261D19]